MYLRQDHSLYLPKEDFHAVSVATSHLYHARYRRKVLSIVDSLTILDWKPREEPTSNYQNFDGFLDQFDPFPISTQFQKANKPWNNKFWRNETHHSLLYFSDRDICRVVKKFKKAGSTKRHVLLAQFNENWGLFSSNITNRTAPWGNLEDYWDNRGCTKKDVMEYLNHDNVLAVITVQHQALRHPKVHSIPLGILNKHELLFAMRRPLVNRSQLLMVNSSPTETRMPQIVSVLSAFSDTGVVNSYGASLENYYKELQMSKFLLSPSGLGWDTYRIWEALYLGAIPVVERYGREDGWHRTLDALPVVWVESFQDPGFNPNFLEKEYERIVDCIETYELEKLTKKYWKSFVESYL
jgi:hypothetical protein